MVLRGFFNEGLIRSSSKVTCCAYCVNIMQNDGGWFGVLELKNLAYVNQLPQLWQLEVDERVIGNIYIVSYTPVSSFNRAPYLVCSFTGDGPCDLPG